MQHCNNYKINREACRMLTFDEGYFTKEIIMKHMINSDIVVSCAKNEDLWGTFVKAFWSINLDMLKWNKDIKNITVV